MLCLDSGLKKTLLSVINCSAFLSITSWSNGDLIGSGLKKILFSNSFFRGILISEMLAGVLSDGSKIG